MQINLKSLFADAEACCLYSKEVTFSDSFLSFASYVEQDKSIYPYWSVQSEPEKFLFIDTCCRYEGDDNIKDYIINHKTEFWRYLEQNTEFSCLESELSTLFYIPEFSIHSILILSDRIIVPRNYSAIELILALAKCESAKIYFSRVFSKLMTLTGGRGWLDLPSFCARIEGDTLYPMHLSIIAKIDELIGAPPSP